MTKAILVRGRGQVVPVNFQAVFLSFGGGQVGCRRGGGMEAFLPVTTPIESRGLGQYLYRSLKTCVFEELTYCGKFQSF